MKVVTGSIFHILLLQLIENTCFESYKKQNNSEILEFQQNKTLKKCTKQYKNVLNDWILGTKKGDQEENVY